MPTIGIDLGTTNTVMAAVRIDGDAAVYENQSGSRLTPSFVAYDAKIKKWLVGDIAKRQASANPINTYYSVKRLIGRKFDDEKVQKLLPTLSYGVKPDGEGKACVTCLVDNEETLYRPEYISSLLLKKIKDDAEVRLHTQITSAVVTVPAYFDDAQRQATKEAARLAGFTEIRLADEPVAAALAYAKDINENETIAVFDLGGGTYDVTILDITRGITNNQNVLAVSGDCWLGGDDFDNVIIDELIKDFKRRHNIDLRNDPSAKQRLREAAERAKKDLSTLSETSINIPYISGRIGLDSTITRKRLNELCGTLLQRTRKPFLDCTNDAEKMGKKISRLILVGGMTRMVSIQETAASLAKLKPRQDTNLDEVVAAGAAIYSRVAPETATSVVPHTLSTDIAGGMVSRIIERNSNRPISKSARYKTTVDNQTSVNVLVLQGEADTVANNIELGRFVLSGIPPKPKGEAKIDVTFEVDIDGVL